MIGLINFISNFMFMQIRKLIIFLCLFDHTDACTYPPIPWAEEKLASYVQKLVNMIVKPIIVHRYLVHGLGILVAKVNLVIKKCSCNKFQLSQIAVIIRF